jgi:hypothetical protein
VEAASRLGGKSSLIDARIRVTSSRKVNASSSWDETEGNLKGPTSGQRAFAGLAGGADAGWGMSHGLQRHSRGRAPSIRVHAWDVR